MRKSIAIGLAMLLALAAGCAPKTFSGNTLVHQGPVPEMVPDKNTAVVTFYRPIEVVGSLLSFFVQENGENIGGLKNGTYFSVRTSPGIHTYTAAGPVIEDDAITVTTKANSTTYIESTISPGTSWRPTPRLREIPAVTAKTEIPRLKYIEFSPGGQWGQSNAYGY